MQVSVQSEPNATAAAGFGGSSTVVDPIIDRAGGTGWLTLLDSDGHAANRLTWRELHLRASRMAAVLARHAIGPGCRVALSGETSANLVTALQAVWLAGAAVVMLPPASPKSRGGHAGQLQAVLADARVDLLIDDRGVDPASLDDPLAGPGSATGRPPPVLALADLAAGAGRERPAMPRRPAPGDLALLQYTSGSTRSPRGVPVSHGHLAANIQAMKVALGDEVRARPLSWLPLYHDMGLIAFLCMPMESDCDLLLQPPTGFARHPASWLHAMSRHRPTMCGAPNFAYALMARLLAAGRSDLDLGSVRCFVSGGEPVDAAMMARLVEVGRPAGLNPTAFMPAYGLAETTLAATVSPVGEGVRTDRVDVEALEVEGRAVPPAPGRQARELVRVGPPVPGTTIRIVDRRTGEPVAERVVGHVELRGPSVVGHYWPDPPPPPGHWLDTGDLGYLAEGELVICGRAKDVLFAAGRNIYPQDVEAAAAEVPGVRVSRAAAFGVPGTAGDRLVVVVETRSNRDPASVKRSVAAAVTDEVGLAPTDVVLVPFGRLPKTTSGKLRRAEARQRYLAGDYTGSSSRRES